MRCDFDGDQYADVLTQCFPTLIVLLMLRYTRNSLVRSHPRRSMK
jgi:hypothetical protein